MAYRIFVFIWAEGTGTGPNYLRTILAEEAKKIYELNKP